MKTTRPTCFTEILEARIAPAVVFAIDSANNLLSFDSASPGTITGSHAITGLGTGETLLGIDFRPATGALYGLGSTERLYTINPETGVATPGALLAADPADATDPFTGLAGANFGVDFNPSADRLRVVNGSDQNLRINVDTGLVTTDTDLNPGTPRVVGSAYTNNFAGAGSTSLYGIDSDTDTLVLQNPPNGGTLTDVGLLGVDTTEVVGFDILTTGTAGGNTAFAALKQAVPGSALYTINLTTGAATLVGDIGGTAINEIRGLAVVPQQAIAVNGRTATFTDVDGDLVTVTTSQGAFNIADFQLVQAGDGFQLRTLNLSDDGTEFAGATISITATRSAGGGDGLVNVGSINATGVDLAVVTVEGDLGQIDAGDAVTASPALGNLFVQSIGLLGTSTQGATPNSESAFVGGVGAINVTFGITDSSITVSGAADGDLRKLKVGAGLDNVDVTVSGNIGSVDEGDAPGAYQLTGGIVVAGSVTDSGVDVGDSLSKLRIGANLDNTRIRVEGSTAPLTNRLATAIGGVTIGGSVLDSSLLVGTLENNADVRVGFVTAGGNWVASDLAIGVDDGADNIYGTSDDVLLANNTAGIIARISKIKVAGQAIGTPTPTTDGFGFVAEQIDLFKVGSTKFPLTTGKDSFEVGSTDDVRVREASAPIT